jgi:hypothetical protein
MREAIAAAEAEPPADPELLFENAFVFRRRQHPRGLAWLSFPSSRPSTTRSTSSWSATTA